MPDIEGQAREQDAVLWPFRAFDSQGGILLDDMVELNAADGNGVRWKWTRTEMMDPQRATVTVDATVVVAVDRDVPVDSLIWLGSAADLSGTAGSFDEAPSGLCQVKAQRWTPDIKGRVTRRTLGVVRYRGRFPTGAG